MTPALRKFVRPTFDVLEARLVPASTLVNGTLIVNGGEGGDRIDINPVGGDGMAFVRVVENGMATDYPAGEVHRVRVYGNGGDDSISHNVGGLNAALYGGDGRDLMYGDTGRDYLNGGPGNDTLHGWGGNDTIVGGEGWDKLYGEDGFDRLFGGPNGDWLCAGSAAEPAVGGAGWDWNAHTWAYNGARSTDINQQAASTCVFLSSLGGIALTGQFDLAGQINYVGDDTYMVRLFVNGFWQDVPVWFNGDLTANANGLYDVMGDREGEFWQLLYQRAYMRTIGYNPYDAASMATFEGEFNGNQALTMISGWASNTVRVDAGTAPEALAELLGNQYAITAAYAGHEYAVTRVYRSGGRWLVRLYNPWGADRVHNPNLLRRPDGVNDGYMVITWDNFVGTFHQYSYA